MSYGYLTARVVNRFSKVVRTTTGIRVPCPAHSDTHPSLDIDEKYGKLLLICRAGCSQSNVIEALGLKAADMDEDAASREEKRTLAEREVARYRYGTKIEKRRYESYEQGERRKRMAWFVTEDGEAWRTKTSNDEWKPELYNAAAVSANPSADVWIVEGEKACDAMTEHGFVAVSNPNGSGEGKLREKYGETLRGRRVSILPDNDEAGEKHAAEWMAALEGIAAHREIVRLPGLPPKGDAFDWFASGKTAAELRDVTLNADASAARIYVIDSPMLVRLMDYYQNGFPKGESTGISELDRYYKVFKGSLCVVTGVPNYGKSGFLDQVMVNLARRSAWRFGVFSAENPTEMHIIGLTQKLTRKSFDLEGSPRMSQDEFQQAVMDIRSKFFFVREKERLLTLDAILEAGRTLVEREGIDGFVIDPWNTIEHRRDKHFSETEYVAQALGKVRQFVRDSNAAVWIVAHPTKMQRKDAINFERPSLYDIAGSANWRNVPDQGLVVHREFYEELDDRGRSMVLRSRTHVSVQKVRFNWMGQIGVAEVSFDMNSQSYGPELWIERTA